MALVELLADETEERSYSEYTWLKRQYA